MSDLFESKQMDGKPPVEQATQAIAYALRRINENPQIGWHAGMGTQMFSLLTEAYATLTGKTVKEVREAFAPDCEAADPEPLFTAAENAADFLLKTDDDERRELGDALSKALETFKHAR